MRGRENYGSHPVPSKENADGWRNPLVAPKLEPRAQNPLLITVMPRFAFGLVIVSCVLAAAAGTASCGESGGGAAGSAGSAAAAASGGTGGAGGDGGSGGTDGGDTGGAASECIDIHVVSDMLPQGTIEWGPGSTGQVERDTLWRDEHGLHFAWQPWVVSDGSGTVAAFVISTFDPDDGKSVAHRIFPDFGFGGIARAPSGVVCIAGGYPQDGGVSSGALLIDQDDPSVEKFVPLYAGSKAFIHVGWDGDAFAVHAWGDTGLEVSRVNESGDVLLSPTVFGVADGFQPDVRMSTDPVNGASFAISGQFKPVPWITGHLRNGSPIPGTEADGGKPVPYQAATLGAAVGVSFHAVRAIAGGALAAWSVGTTQTDGNVLVQALDTNLNPTADLVFVPPTIHEGFAETKDWLTIQQQPDGWWIGAEGGLFLESVRLDASGISVESISSYELARTNVAPLDYRQLASASYGDAELWLGFSDLTAGDSWGKPYSPYRIVRVRPGCVYASLWDLSKSQ